MEKFMDGSYPVNRQSVCLSNVTAFFECLDSGLVNNDSAEYYKELAEKDYTDVFEDMLKDR